MAMIITDAAAMEALGAHLFRQLTPGVLIFLQGELGTGKTTLVRGAIRAAGYSGPVRSPTFTLVETYAYAAGKIHHFDLYRLTDPEEAELIGIRDYLRPDTICFVEWPERAAQILPSPDLVITLEHDGIARKVHLQSSRLPLDLAHISSK